MNRRIIRLNMGLKKILMEYFTRRMKGHFPGFISVKESWMAKDMKSAKVFLSLMSEKNHKEEVLQILEEQRFLIQKTVSKSLKMKFCPKLNFFVNHVPYSLSPPSHPPGLVSSAPSSLP